MSEPKSSHHATELHPGSSLNEQQHVEPGTGEDDEWIDASGTASPYLSRNASLKSENIQDGLNVETNKDKAISRCIPHEPKSESDILQDDHHLSSNYCQETTSKSTRLSSRYQEAVPPMNQSCVASASSLRHQRSTIPLQAALPRTTTEHLYDRDNTVDAPSEDDEGRALGPNLNRRMLASRTSDHYRTQMKIELQRASDSQDRIRAPSSDNDEHHLPGIWEAAMNDTPRAGVHFSKLLERSSIEYQVVCRYKSPLSDSFFRLRPLHLAPHSKII